MTTIIQQKGYREETVMSYLTVEPKLKMTVAMNLVKCFQTLGLFLR